MENSDMYDVLVCDGKFHEEDIAYVKFEMISRDEVDLLISLAARQACIDVVVRGRKV